MRVAQWRNQVQKFTNESSGFVAYKVKSTAPQSHFVRPREGVLEAGQIAEVQIILRQQGGEVQADQHRFLVQAVPATSATLLSREEWTERRDKKGPVQMLRFSVLLDRFEADSLPKPTDEAAKAADITHPEDLQVKEDGLERFALDLEKERKVAEDILEKRKRDSEVEKPSLPRGRWRYLRFNAWTNSPPVCEPSTTATVEIPQGGPHITTVEKIGELPMTRTVEKVREVPKVGEMVQSQPQVDFPVIQAVGQIADVPVV